MKELARMVINPPVIGCFLKPCPFCKCADVGLGSEASDGNHVSPQSPRIRFVACAKCGARSPEEIEGVSPQVYAVAIDGWNKAVR